MNWIHNADIALFRLINGDLSNPVFDKLMPFVSGNVFFAPVLTVLAVLLIWKGRERGLICALMMGAAVGTCDGLICRTMKHAVGRPRPFQVLTAVKTPGRTSAKKPARAVETKGTVPKNAPPVTGNSMPSAHAANWFAATMVALVYYRKSIRFMLPLACLVSFSRIYNGVHYPTDVLIGAIVGAGHAAALIWLLDAFWTWAGPKWFPRWFTAMPSLTGLRPGNKSQPPAQHA